MVKPFPETGYFSYESLSKKSLSTLYRLRRAEKESRGTIHWYGWPCNIEKLLNICIKEKRNVQRKDKTEVR